MLRRCIVLGVVAFAWIGSEGAAAAQHERAYEFDGTHVAVSIERFMGIDYTDYEGPIEGEINARLLLNANEPAPTHFARLGFDVFIERLSIGVAGGVATEPGPNDAAVIAPRVGYLFGLTPELGLWLRGGAFYATSGPDWAGIYVEGLFSWFPYSFLALTFGPTLDVAFASEDTEPDYVSIGILSFGVSAFF